MTDTQTGNICFVTPRYADSGTVGGAETLLRELAESAAEAGKHVTILTTCARNHFTWENERPAGTEEKNGITIRFFPVDEDRNIDTFLRIQQTISAGRSVSDGDEDQWLRNNVNSLQLTEWLKANADSLDRIIMGPYLFGLIEAASRIAPKKTLLIPCLHDEPFARVRRIAEMFTNVHGSIFNTDPERLLAQRLYGKENCRSCGVVGMGISPFEADPQAFAKNHDITSPYVIYCGRRELLKGTPLLADYIDLYRKRSGRDLKLILTGSGVIDCPPSLKPHMIDCGFVSEQEKHEAMAGAVAFCHPSVNESLGIVLLEAWLAGTPALVHANGEVLRHQCRESGGGLWFKDYPEFEAQLTRLADDKALNSALAASGRDFVIREYAPEAVQHKLLNALEM